MKIRKPRITNVMRKNMQVKYPHCGWYNRMPKTDRAFTCKKCRQGVALDKDYKVDDYY